MTSPNTTARPEPSRFTWNVALAIIRPAAALMAAWSLYAVARHYGVPRGLALLASLVYDGVAMGCLYQATEAVKAGRSAVAPIIATIGQASASVYLNIVHARLTGGGRPAEVLFAAPIVGLLVLSSLSWTADRAAARAARGESAMRLPAYGLLGWALAREQATASLKARAVEHVTGASPARPDTSRQRPRTAHAVLAERFAAMDPADAIEIAADSHPNLGPAELADLLADYGVTVDTMHVALVLGGPHVTLDRYPDNARTRPDTLPGAGPRPALTKADTARTRPGSAAEAIRQLIDRGITDPDIVPTQTARLLGRRVDHASVRRELGRQLEKQQARQAVAEAEQVGKGGGGYA
ncbi:hypothetical protein [Kitasatospora sp. NPDC050543]|uniref:hypothetical protein n=1 Tax=Kitasatospora sp. NPDC050543 TaxID=3364054 RepID=UPI0037B12E34